MYDDVLPTTDQAPPADAITESAPLLRAPFFVAPPTTGFTPTLHRAEVSDRALFIDTETTGRSVTSEIIEVAVCDVDGNILFESLVRPTASVPRAAARIHGLTTEMLVCASTWERVWAQLMPLVSGRVLIAYNAAFDRRMIEVMAACYRLPLPVLRWRCAMQFVKEQDGLRRAPSLTEACQRYGVEPGTHRAASDAQATARLLRKML